MFTWRRQSVGQLLLQCLSGSVHLKTHTPNNNTDKKIYENLDKFHISWEVASQQFISY